MLILKAENFKRLKVLQFVITESGITELKGRNKQGKTSAIDAIASAIGGKRLCPENPIREGENHAKVEFEKEGCFRIVRTWKLVDGQTKGQLKITGARGEKLQQCDLDRLLGKACFDPTSFLTLTPRQQRDELIKVSELDERDLVKINQEYSDLFADRTVVNRNIAREQGVIDELEDSGENQELARQEVKKTAELLTELECIRNKNDRHDEIDNKLCGAQARTEKLESDKEGHLQEIERLKNKVSEIDDSINIANKESENLKKELSSLPLYDYDGEGRVKKEITELEETNEVIRAAKQCLDDQEKVRRYFDELTKKSDGITERLKHLSEAKNQELKKAKFPIKALSFNDDGIMYNNQPFSQASGSERFIAALSIATTGNNELKLILMRDGSLIDKDNLEKIDKYLKSKKFVGIIERVSDDRESGIIIEDGEIAD